MTFVHPILFIVFFLYYDYTNNFVFAIFLASTTLGERSSGSIGHKYYSPKRKINLNNGGGKGF